MSILHGTYTLGLLTVGAFVAILTYYTYKLLSSYLYKWHEMKPIPEIGGALPFVGNALQFEANAGGEMRKGRWEKHVHYCYVWPRLPEVCLKQQQIIIGKHKTQIFPQSFAMYFVLSFQIYYVSLSTAQSSSRTLHC